MAKETGGARTRITVKVQPQAKATRVAGRMEKAYRLQLAAPPVDGKANEACVAFLAALQRYPRSRPCFAPRDDAAFIILSLNW